MTTMVEKMAKAIAKAAVEQNPMLEYFDDNGVGYFDDYDNKNYDCIAIARAAIEAMAAPGGYVEEAGWQKSRTMLQEDWLSLDEIGQIFNEMIQAALKEGQE